ncbi:hypothetical protein Tco_0157227 [Tanacetum coccineum]
MVIDSPYYSVYEELASPEQTATGKDVSNPLYGCDGLPKTVRVFQFTLDSRSEKLDWFLLHQDWKLLFFDVAASFDSAVHRVHAVSFDAAVASTVSAACIVAAGYITSLSFALLNVHNRAEGAKKHAAALRRLMVDIVSHPLSSQNLLGEASTSAVAFCVDDLDTDKDLGSVVCMPHLEDPHSCITKLLKEVNSHAKIQSHKTRNSNKPVDQKSHTQKPGRQIFTRHRFSPNKTSAVYEKTSPRSDLRWKPTGRIFKSVGLRWIPTGKLFDSYTSKVDSEPTTRFQIVPLLKSSRKTQSMVAEKADISETIVNMDSQMMIQKNNV